MTSYKKLLAFSSSLCLLYSAPSLAQETEEEEEYTGAFVIDEIVVTGRKREESLQDIPVSISVIGQDYLNEQNILTQGDLADLVPGLNYDQGNNGPFDDRIGGTTSIRGIASNEIATNRTKVTSFVDGMPIIGSVGAINIGGSTQVEVYSGPQSAAFGRSTFAGAINYTLPDPSEELEGNLGLNLSDTGTRIISGSVGGPITDTLGFQLSGQYEDSVSQDSDVYTFSDGVEGDTISGKNVMARLVWEPTDNFKAKLTFTHDSTEDGPTPDLYATQESSLACFETLTPFTYASDMGGRPVTGYEGYFDCDLQLETEAAAIGYNSIIDFYGTDAGAAVLEQQIADAVAAGAGTEADVREDILLLAEAYSVPNPGSENDRDRVFVQLDYALNDGDAGVLQFSYMESEEFYSRHVSDNDTEVPYAITYEVDPMTMTAAYSVAQNMMAESDPTDIEETYAELRWASPADERIRYVAGVSYYDYTFYTNIFRSSAYNGFTLGINDEVAELVGSDGENLTFPQTILGEETTNTAAFFNVTYDFSETITASLEGRYTRDEVGASSTTATESQTSNSFVPRLGINYSPNPETTLYFQYAVGVNPGGVTSDLLDETTLNLLNNGVPVDDTVYGGNINTTQSYVNYDSDDYLFYDEETLTNYEIGFKGSAFDGRLSYTGAVYHMIWEDAINSVNLDWDYTYADDDLAGTLVEGTTDVYYVPTTDNTGARVSTNAGTSETTGLELQGNYRITDQWSLGGNLSLSSAKYKDYCSSSDYTGFAGDLGEYAGAEVGSNDLGQPCYVLDGNELERQPGFTMSLAPSYRTELSNGMGMSATARWQYTGSQYGDVFGISKVPASDTLNLTFGLSMDAWSASFYIQNVFDDTTSTSGNLVQAANFAADYPGVTQNSDLFFSSGPNTYSNFSMRYPTGRNFGLRLNYRL